MRFSTRWWNVGVFVLSLVLLGLWTYRLVGDVRAYRQARQLKAERLAALRFAEEQRDAAREYVRRLRSDRDTKEQLVRGMGFAKPNEEIYVVPASAASSATKTAASIR
jgi:cell division protein FtsB